MAITSLFPKENEPLKIRQGKAGDCYLLVVLDCLYGTEDGRKLIQSMFTQTPEGIEVRIKASNLSKRLQYEKMEGKYEYRATPTEDIFFLSNDRLQKIDQKSSGVHTNSLAIKILERLISYYYSCDWETNSLIAHNEPYIGDQLNILRNFFSIEIKQSYDINKMIKLKQRNPDEPIFIGMRYGKFDIYNSHHCQHALRVDKLSSDSNGQYFTLINPWNNQACNKNGELGEKFYVKYLKKRDCCFLTFPDIDVNKPQKVLKSLNFDNYLSHIERMVEKLEKKITIKDEKIQNLRNKPIINKKELEKKLAKNCRYKRALSDCQLYLKELSTAKENFLSYGKADRVSVKQFQDTCRRIADKLYPTLNEHQGWKNVVFNFLSLISPLEKRTHLMNKFSANKLSFFTLKTTKSLVEAIKRVKLRAEVNLG